MKLTKQEKNKTIFAIVFFGTFTLIMAFSSVLLWLGLTKVSLNIYINYNNFAYLFVCLLLPLVYIQMAYYSFANEVNKQIEKLKGGKGV